MATPHDAAWDNFENTLNAGLPLQEAWAKIITFHSAAMPMAISDKLKALNVEVDQSSLAAWMEKLLTDSPLPESVVAIWLGIAKLWDEEEEKEFYAVYLSGTDNYDAEDADWAVEPAYDPENKYIIPDIPNEVDEIIKVDTENYDFLDWILPLAYTALAFDDIIKTKLNKPAFLKHQKSLSVAVGFDGGDFINIAVIQ